MPETTNSSIARDPGQRRYRFGLSDQLLVLTILFVMLAEVLIYVPSVANFRITWLSDRLAAAHTAALVLDAAPSGMVPDSLARQILDSIDARAVAMKTGQQRSLLATAEFPASAIIQTVDVRDVSALTAIVDAFQILFTARDSDLIRAVGPAPKGGEFVEIVLAVGPLKNAMWRYSRNVLLLSLIISAITATLVYLALHYLFVRPLHRITANMTAFSADPENPSRIIMASSRTDELGVAERELAAMQRDLASMLAQRYRLAALGLAVSKINHDLRNMLANAQLISDRLVDIPDPTVQRFVPKLIASLDRAISFCNSSLQFGRAAEAAPRRELFRLRRLVEEVADSQGLPREGEIAFDVAIEEGLRIDADREHLFRVMSNLVRNAVQAIEAVGPGKPGEVRVAASRHGRSVEIVVSDTGPGVPAKARATLFRAFQGSSKKGGTGLGLAIAAELVAAHGGRVRLLETDQGAAFLIELPDRGQV